MMYLDSNMNVQMQVYCGMEHSSDGLDVSHGGPSIHMCGQTVKLVIFCIILLHNIHQCYLQ